MVPRDGNGILENELCHHGATQDAKVEDVIATFNYLVSIGDHKCVADSEGAVFVKTYTAEVSGSSVTSGVTVSVPWYDECFPFLYLTLYVR